MSLENFGTSITESLKLQVCQFQRYIQGNSSYGDRSMLQPMRFLDRPSMMFQIHDHTCMGRPAADAWGIAVLMFARMDTKACAKYANLIA